MFSIFLAKNFAKFYYSLHFCKKLQFQCNYGEICTNYFVTTKKLLVCACSSKQWRIFLLKVALILGFLDKFTKSFDKKNMKVCTDFSFQLHYFLLEVQLNLKNELQSLFFAFQLHFLVAHIVILHLKIPEQLINCSAQCVRMHRQQKSQILCLGTFLENLRVLEGMGPYLKVLMPSG